MKLFKHDFFKIFCVTALTVFAAYFSASYRVSPNAGPNMAWGATGASGTGSFNNHTLLDGAAPTLSNCGLNPVILSTSSDNAGWIRVGSVTRNNLGQNVPVLQCTITWATAFTSAPSISVTMNNNATRKSGVGGINVIIASNSTTVTTLYFDTDASDASFSYVGF